MSEYSKTSITAKVFNIGDKENQLLRNNTQMEKALAVVADGSGQITVTLWADAIAKVQIGKSYKFANLSVRIFHEEKNLNTTPETEVTEIDDIGAARCPNPQIVNARTTKVIKIISASCQMILTCIVCKKSIDVQNTQLDYVKCTACLMKQRTIDLDKTFKTQIYATLDDTKARFMLPESTRKSNPILANLDSSQHIENILLENPNVEVSIENMMIKNIKFQ